MKRRAHSEGRVFRIGIDKCRLCGRDFSESEKEYWIRNIEPGRIDSNNPSARYSKIVEYFIICKKCLDNMPDETVQELYNNHFRFNNMNNRRAKRYVDMISRCPS